MEASYTIIYGLVQGVTEFLPVSSSGHLALIPHFLKISDPGVAFDLAMHLGTALSICCYFYKEIKELLWQTFNIFQLKYKEFPYALNMMVATLTTFLVALGIKGIAEVYGRGPKMIAANLIVFGVLMFIADYRGSKGVTNTMYQKFQWKKSFLIGFFQALAIFPGVSRSGSTLTISRFIGMSREEATRFSFLLSLPVIFGGMIFKGRELFENPSVDWSAISIGLTVSFLTGLLTIHYFLKFIKKMGLGLFSIYRILFALFLLSYF